MRCRGLLLIVVACNQTYGLDETILIGDDLDGDQVENAKDNCPNVPNGGQEDLDRDSIGDACDLCPDIVTDDGNHDEDDDGRGDACDSCPGLADFAGNDNDMDGIGDTCDLQSGFESGRLLFDPFVTLVGWSGDLALWQPTGDAVAPTTPLAADDHGLSPDSLQLTGNAWWMSVGFSARTKWRDGDYFGVGFSDAASGTIVVRCFIECASGQCSEYIDQVGMAIPLLVATATPRFEISASARNGGSFGVNCSFGGQLVGATTTPLPAILKPRIFASPNVHAAFAFAAN